MKRIVIRTRILMPILLALLVLAAAGNALGQDPIVGVKYHIIAKNSGKCLDVAGGRREPGIQVIQYDCGQGLNQTWTFFGALNDPSHYQILAKHSALALNVFGGIYSLGDGVMVPQFA